MFPAGRVHTMVAQNNREWYCRRKSPISPRSTVSTRLYEKRTLVASNSLACSMKTASRLIVQRGCFFVVRQDIFLSFFIALGCTRWRSYLAHCLVSNCEPVATCNSFLSESKMEPRFTKVIQTQRVCDFGAKNSL
jgi:hypothetical protein